MADDDGSPPSPQSSSSHAATAAAIAAARDRNAGGDGNDGNGNDGNNDTNNAYNFHPDTDDDELIVVQQHQQQQEQETTPTRRNNHHDSAILETPERSGDEASACVDSDDGVDDDDDDDEREELLASVGDAIHRIVSSSDLGLALSTTTETATAEETPTDQEAATRRDDEKEGQTEEEGEEADDTATTSTSNNKKKKNVFITLNDAQVATLRNLEDKIRTMLLAAQSQHRKYVTPRIRHISSSDRPKLHQLIQSTSVGVKKRFRKVVTGSEEHRFRDWMKQATIVKTVDKFSFVLGVVALMATEFMVLRRPEQFKLYYVGSMSIMMLLRLYMYAKLEWLYFMIDWCYLANLFCFLSCLVWPDSARLWRMNFAVTNGSLLGALLAWRNSLVFHSLDKVTSIALHLLPGILTCIERWWFAPAVGNDVTDTDAGSRTSTSVMCADDQYDCTSIVGFAGAIFDCIVCYVMWQAFYIIKTEIIDHHYFQANPEIPTSLRWLTRDRKNVMHVVAKRICRKIGYLGPKEEFDPAALKTKIVFWVGQFIFMLICTLPTFFLFVNETANLAYILFCISSIIYNGSSYYFEVFAARYVQQIERQEAKIASLKRTDPNSRRAAAAAAATIEVERPQSGNEQCTSEGTQEVDVNKKNE